MDQYGNNLNRYYNNPDLVQQPSIFAAKSLLDFYAENQQLVIYLDLHAHASRKGSFIYGNVLDNLDDQVQNQLFCKLIEINTKHFNYKGCLFSKDHMMRIDPGDKVKGLSASGSGRVYNYLRHHILHSYTLECNYNTYRESTRELKTNHSNDLHSSLSSSSMEEDMHLANHNFTTTMDITNSTNLKSPRHHKVLTSPQVYTKLGQSCMISILDIAKQNPAPSHLVGSNQHFNRIIQSVIRDVKYRPEYRTVLKGRLFGRYDIDQRIINYYDRFNEDKNLSFKTISTRDHNNDPTSNQIPFNVYDHITAITSTSAENGLKTEGGKLLEESDNQENGKNEIIANEQFPIEIFNKELGDFDSCVLIVKKLTIESPNKNVCVKVSNRNQNYNLPTIPQSERIPNMMLEMRTLAKVNDHMKRPQLLDFESRQPMRNINSSITHYLNEREEDASIKTYNYRKNFPSVLHITNRKNSFPINCYFSKERRNISRCDMDSDLISLPSQFMPSSIHHNHYSFPDIRLKSNS
jgi:hypothetical protein